MHSNLLSRWSFWNRAHKSMYFCRSFFSSLSSRPLVFFNEPTFFNFLTMLIQFAFPQIRDRQPGVIFQLDGAPLHWGLNVRGSLEAECPGRWIGCEGPSHCRLDRQILHPWIFFLLGVYKDWSVQETCGKSQPIKTSHTSCCSYGQQRRAWNWSPGFSCSVTMEVATLKCTDVLGPLFVFSSCIFL